MREIGFDADKYIEEQSKYILERIKAGNGKRLYLEFGGKLVHDKHAMRVLPGFDENAKVKLLQRMKDQAEIIICVYSGDIINSKTRQDFGITYDLEVLRLIDIFRKHDLKINSVVVTRYEDAPAVNRFINKLERRDIKTYTHCFTKGLSLIHICDGNTVLHRGTAVGQILDLDAGSGTSFHITIFDQRFRDTFNLVNRNGEAETFDIGAGGFRDDQTDQIAVLVKESAAGVARIDGGAGLNQGHGFAVNRNFAFQRADDAVGCRTGKRPERVADGNCQAADGDLIHAAHADRSQTCFVNLDDGDIGLRVGRDECRGIGLAVV